MQSGVATTWAARNEYLGNSASADDFVFRTAVAESANPTVPLIVHQEAVPIGNAGQSVAAAFTSRIESVVTDWRRTNQPNPTNAGCYLQLTVFADKIPRVGQPVLDPTDLYYPLL